MKSTILAALIVALAAPVALAADNDPHPNWVSYRELLSRGFECKSIGDGLLHCTNPDATDSDWVCPVDGGPCEPGKPQRIGGGGKRNTFAPNLGVMVLKP
jgi:hypothetical protein